MYKKIKQFFGFNKEKTEYQVPKEINIRYDVLDSLYSYQPLIDKNAIKCEETTLSILYNQNEAISLLPICAYITNINLRMRHMHLSVFVKSHEDLLYKYIQLWQQLQKDEPSFKGIEMQFDNIITVHNARLQYISDEVTNTYVGYTKINLVISMGYAEYSVANKEIKEYKAKIKDNEKMIEVINYDFSDASLTLSSKMYNTVSHIELDDNLKKALIKFYKKENENLKKEIEKLLN